MEVPGIARREHGLHTEDGREGLQLDQARCERAVFYAHEAEVGGHEVRMGRAMRHTETLRDCLRGSCEECAVAEELMRQFGAGVDDLLHERTREEAGCLRDAEL